MLGLEINTLDLRGDTFIVYAAAKNGHETIIDILLKHPKFDSDILSDAIKATRDAKHTHS